MEQLLVGRKGERTYVRCVMFGAEFEISKEYEGKLMNKLDVFTRETGTKKTLMLTLITTYGVKPNVYSGIVQSLKC